MREFCFSYQLYSPVNIMQCVKTLQNLTWKNRITKRLYRFMQQPPVCIPLASWTTVWFQTVRWTEYCTTSCWNAFEFPRAYRHCCCCCWFLSSAYVEVIQITGCELMVLYHPLRHKLDTPELRSHKDRYRNSLPINTRYSYIFILDLRPWLYDI